MRVIMRTRAAMLIGALLCLLPLVSAVEDSAENADNQERGWAGTLCSPPEMALDGNSVISSTTDYSKVVEVMFHGAIGPSGERRLCRIQCLHGEWVGPMCQINVAKAPGKRIIFFPILHPSNV
ncbi:Hypothetical predicted protein [Cloeon dipterum]|uniref:Uncharacterized protein n=1 Tax=Cloeon dipterum TaxID=197152 RepID=A0A8S1C241_9INSE|nr:Hypothetical predicted protein [Cloeon dipterum]